MLNSIGVWLLERRNPRSRVHEPLVPPGIHRCLNAKGSVSGAEQDFTGVVEGKPILQEAIMHCPSAYDSQLDGAKR